MKESGVHITMQVENDVQILREFFDDCIAEVQFKANNATIMRDAAEATRQSTKAMPSGTLLHIRQKGGFVRTKRTTPGSASGPGGHAPARSLRPRIIAFPTSPKLN